MHSTSTPTVVRPVSAARRTFRNRLCRVVGTSKLHIVLQVGFSVYRGRTKLRTQC